MALPPRKPLRPAASSTPRSSPSGKSGLAPGVGTAGAPGNPKPARRPAARRRFVARGSSGEDPLIHRFLIRLGIAVVVLLLGGFGSRGLLSSSSPNQRYFNELADVWNRTDSTNSAQTLRQLKALPSSGVTDPKLKEAQGILVDLCSLPPPPLDEATKSRVLSEIIQLDRLQSELNAKYANR